MAGRTEASRSLRRSSASACRYNFDTRTLTARAAWTPYADKVYFSQLYTADTYPNLACPDRSFRRQACVRKVQEQALERQALESFPSSSILIDRRRASAPGMPVSGCKPMLTVSSYAADEMRAHRAWRRLPRHQMIGSWTLLRSSFRRR